MVKRGAKDIGLRIKRLDVENRYITKYIKKKGAA